VGTNWPAKTKAASKPNRLLRPKTAEKTQDTNKINVPREYNVLSVGSVREVTACVSAAKLRHMKHPNHISPPGSRTLLHAYANQVAKSHSNQLGSHAQS
jgi:hypothetical protein